MADSPIIRPERGTKTVPFVQKAFMVPDERMVIVRGALATSITVSELAMPFATIKKIAAAVLKLEAEKEQGELPEARRLIVT